MSADATPSIGPRLRSEFEDALTKRRPHEERWLRDLRQYKGQHEAEVLARIDKNRSRAFLRITSQRVDAIHARVMDMLFPANGDRNWGIEPTPIPDLDQSVISRLQAAAAANAGGTPDRDALQAAILEEATRMATAMEDAMADHLAEAPGRGGYRGAISRVVRSAVLYGAGVLKGPLVQSRREVRWRFLEPEGGTSSSAMKLHEVAGGYLPFFEFVPLWDLYPDPTAITRDELRYVWQAHLMTRRDLADLQRRPGFDMDAIRSFISGNKDGDATPSNAERQLREAGSSDETISVDLSGRYRVLERWGFLEGRDLGLLGVEIEEGQEDDMFASVVWLLGDQVIRAHVAPVEGVDLPYFFLQLKQDESSLFGEGIASACRDPQAICNSALRAMLDHAAITAGPIVCVNASALSPGEDPRSLYPFRTYLFDSASDMREAMQFYQMTSHTQEFMSIIQMAQGFMDDVSISKIMLGDQSTPGAAQTATGASILANSSATILKAACKAVDDQITAPFITALYYWEMQFNPDESIKGDFRIMARASSHLAAKELQAQALIRAAEVSRSQMFAELIKPRELLEQLFLAMDVKDVLKTDKEVLADQERQAAVAAQGQIQAIMGEAQRRGIDPRTILPGLAAQAVQAGPGQQPVPPQGGQPVSFGG